MFILIYKIDLPIKIFHEYINILYKINKIRTYNLYIYIYRIKILIDWLEKLIQISIKSMACCKLILICHISISISFIFNLTLQKNTNQIVEII